MNDLSATGSALEACLTAVKKAGTGKVTDVVAVQPAPALTSIAMIAQAPPKADVKEFGEATWPVINDAKEPVKLRKGLIGSNKRRRSS